MLIAIPDIKSKVPSWPYEPAGTYRLIRLGQLGRIQVGRNYFVTEELLAEFVERHKTIGATPTKPRAKRAA